MKNSYQKYNTASLSVSVDDGEKNDLRVGELLLKGKIPGIFYIPIIPGNGKKRLKDREIRYLSKNFEIGSHGLNHEDLTQLPFKKLIASLYDAKAKLEDILGKQVSTLAPPFGKYDEKVLRAAKRAGFKDVRSARVINFEKPERKNFLWNPNLHFYPHSRFTDISHLLKNGDFAGFIKRVGLIDKNHLELGEVFKLRGKSYHVWLHSEDLERHHLWEDFSRLLT